MKTRFFILLVLASFSMSSATIINVPGDSATIQGGLNGSADGDTVLVQPGTYVENIRFNGHNVVLGSLFLTTGDTSYISTTIIDGDSSGSVVTFMSGEDSTASITGFTIQNGYMGFGGGIYCYYSNPIIRNNIVRENFAPYLGGGIYCDNTNPRINDNTILGNMSEQGGGIYCWYANPILSENIVLLNIATNNGGGAYFYGCQSPILNKNKFISNSATLYNGGGIRLVYSNNPQMSGNLIAFNSAGQSGGGIECGLYSSPTILNNTITANSADSGGGGISINNGNPIIINTICWSNTSPYGPEIYNYSGTPTVTYSDIYGGWPGEGNISCDPMFCFPDTGNFYLADTSCCVGAGQNGVDIGAFSVGCCDYFVGDVNNSDNYNGLDIIYGVNFLKGGISPYCNCDCPPHGMWFICGDVNGSCSYSGLDITYGVSYLKGIHTELLPCPDCPPTE